MSSLPRIGGAAAQGVAIASDDGVFLPEIGELLRLRGFVPRAMTYQDAVDDPTVGAIAVAPQQGLNPALAFRLSPYVRAGAEKKTPFIIFAPIPEDEQSLEEHIIATGSLVCHGALITDDPDVWLEALVLAGNWGIPQSPGVAIVAPSGTWLDAQSKRLGEQLGAHWRKLPKQTKDSIGTVLAQVQPEMPHSIGPSLVVPLRPRGELRDSNQQATLIGLTASLQAARLLGEIGQRIDENALGHGTFSGDIDEARFQKQLAQINTRVGDHETKVMMKAFGVPIIRQAVATTPSAATRVAQKAGYPVELKPWGPTIPSEGNGCPVERDLHTAAQVRQAFAVVSKKANLEPGSPVIVRETPAHGRELEARVTQIGSLGWVLIMKVQGEKLPIARLAPLHPMDALALAYQIGSTRLDEKEPNREQLAELLQCLAAMGPLGERVQVVHAHRIVAASDADKIMVIDASAILQPA